MDEFIKQAALLPTARFNPPAESEKIILCQKELIENGFPALPEDFLAFLHHYNGFAYQGAFIFGIRPCADCFTDISRENALADIPEDKELVILGSNEYDYLAYNAQGSTYQILDKYSFEILTEYDSCADAVRHILRIDTI